MSPEQYAELCRKLESQDALFDKRVPTDSADKWISCLNEPGDKHSAQKLKEFSATSLNTAEHESITAVLAGRAEDKKFSRDEFLKLFDDELKLSELVQKEGLRAKVKEW